MYTFCYEICHNIYFMSYIHLKLFIIFYKIQRNKSKLLNSMHVHSRKNQTGFCSMIALFLNINKNVCKNEY